MSSQGRTKRERINRLRKRFDDVQTATVEGAQLLSLLKAIVDLLEDEL